MSFSDGTLFLFRASIVENANESPDWIIRNEPLLLLLFDALQTKWKQTHYGDVARHVLYSAIKDRQRPTVNGINLIF